MIFRPQDVICMAKQEKKYSERVMLIYDGLHYDALAISPFEGAPEEFDQTIFPVQKGRTIGPAEDLALKLVKEQQRKKTYTDTANFTLCYGVCQIGVIGQKAIAATVASDTVKHSEAFIGKSNQDYCSWIQDPEKWGGAVNFFFSLNKHAFVSARQLQEHG
ncbi:hypothetical protein CUMW_193980 [Citrus unshiu]|uniref:Ubiquitin thioesterase OTU n=2 Tax=Citrus TaxID=2706 RepID=A0A2H5Q503_CITUN|nr:hypothetical protein CUMW_193980 [Citrus unshiu]